VDPALIAWLKEGGLFLWAAGSTYWAVTLYRDRKESEVRAEAKADAREAACVACQKAHNEQLVTVTTGSIRAIEQSTAAIAAANRQEEIIKLLQRDSRSQRAPGPSL
jgi:hypothetical protein